MCRAAYQSAAPSRWRVASRSRQHGALLVEVLVALAVTGVGMVAVLALLTQAVAVRATELQRMRLARLVADAGEIAAMHSAASRAELDAELVAWAGRATAALPGVTATAALTDRDGLQLADVRLSYRDRHGHPHTVQRSYPITPAS